MSNINKGRVLNKNISYSKLEYKKSPGNTRSKKIIINYQLLEVILSINRVAHEDLLYFSNLIFYCYL